MCYISLCWESISSNISLTSDCNATACGGCLGALQPRCGFCVATGLCGETSSLVGCTSSKLNACPVISAVSPSASTPRGNISVVVTGEFVGTVSYHCFFSIGPLVNYTVAATAVTATTITCTAPDASASVSSTTAGTVSVYVSQNSDIVPYSSNSLPFRFVVCSQQTVCSSCSLAPQCGWCDLRTCFEMGANATCPSGVVYNSAFACPTITSISPDHSQVDSTTQVTIRGSNFVSSNKLRLFCSWGDYFLSSATVVNSTAISCEYRIPLGVDAPPLAPVEVTIKSSTSSLLALSALPFDLYDCTATPENCTRCGTNPSPYCGWCIESYECVSSDGCAVGSTWLAQSCPTISTVSPAFALISGGAQVAVSGSFYVNSESPSLSLDCSFDNQTTVGILNNATTVTCNVPSVGAPRASRVTIVQGASVRKSFVDNSAPFQFIKCIATQCGSCFTPPDADPRCSWCPYEQTCTTSQYCSAAHPFASDVASCPAIVTVSPSTARLAGGVEIFVSGNLFVNHPNLTCAFGETIVAYVPWSFRLNSS